MGQKVYLKAVTNFSNIPNLGKEMNIQIHEAQRIPNRLNLSWNRDAPRHIVIRLSKDKDEETLWQEDQEDLLL